MTPTIERLMRDYDRVGIPRRNFLFSLPALAAALRGMAQSSKPTIRLRELNHVTLTLRDPKRSLEFYQGLFGMPIQARQGNSVVLQIGAGPQFIVLSGTSGKPRISHFCMTAENFNVDRVLQILAEHGVTRIESSASGGATDIPPLKVWVRLRGEEAGGAKEGTAELHFTDPDGIVVQLQDASYCGGAGALGNVCLGTPEPAPRKGLLALRDYNHVTLAVPNQQRSRAFYRELFGMRAGANQGAGPSLAIGSGRQFLAVGSSTANGSTPGTPGVAHVCFTIEGFDLDKVRKALTDYGLKPRGAATGPVAPLTHYVSLRMPDRGGAPGGTPELYFTDPDGIVIQLQDTSYCGGAGYLGNVCP